MRDHFWTRFFTMIQLQALRFAMKHHFKLARIHCVVFLYRDKASELDVVIRIKEAPKCNWW
jgi:hypothetical protein